MSFCNSQSGFGFEIYGDHFPHNREIAVVIVSVAIMGDRNTTIEIWGHILCTFQISTLVVWSKGSQNPNI